MSAIMLKLAGQLQSWGDSSRFTERQTRHEPTKSGVIGILAAALGRFRDEDISDLATLKMGVRIDQPGSLERDFQTAHLREFDKETQTWKVNTGKSMPISHRYYLSDAVFVVALEGDSALLEACADALLHPSFPLYLGRRSCPPSGKILLSLQNEKTLMQALREWPWEASPRIRQKEHASTVQLAVLRDQLSDEDGQRTQEALRDVPLSFSQNFRYYSWRTVVHDVVTISNPDAPEEHDPWAALEEVG